MDRQHNDQKKKDKRSKQRSTKHINKTKDRVTRTPQKIGGDHKLLILPEHSSSPGPCFPISNFLCNIA
jgi:hypothetical protein